MVVPPEADKNSLPRFAPPDKLKASLFSDETSWKTAAGILLGIVNILGITVFLLRKKKMDAVFENLKQASEYDRKVSGMNY